MLEKTKQVINKKIMVNKNKKKDAKGVVHATHCDGPHQQVYVHVWGHWQLFIH